MNLQSQRPNHVSLPSKIQSLDDKVLHVELALGNSRSLLIHGFRFYAAGNNGFEFALWEHYVRIPSLANFSSTSAFLVFTVLLTFIFFFIYTPLKLFRLWLSELIPCLLCSLFSREILKLVGLDWIYFRVWSLHRSK